MANTTSPLLPATEELLKEFGERLRLARLRRRLQAKEVAERAGMTEVTLRRVERGLPGVTMGSYLAVMQVLQLQDDVAQWATNDPLGRHLQDSELQSRVRLKRIVRNTNTGRFVVPSAKAQSNVKAVRPAQTILAENTILAEKTEGAKPEGASRSVSAADLLKTISMPPIKPASGKNKA